ncbi:MAG TPA: S1/P1 nuclease, partial [Pirellulales bacterium]|nr:S1/P1 nuclease [Pirellulales bacterium]
CLGLTSPALCWNEQGHFLVARLAWYRLSPEERIAASRILRAHPHFEEYLTAERPVGTPMNEWAFMRAAYWPDWIRSNHSEEYSKPAWHYVVAAFVPPQSRFDASAVHAEPPNVVSQIPASVEKIRTGSDAEKAISLCWLIHLIGDIHQPLHCASLYTEAFPEGDRGGNLSLVRIDKGMPIRLHPTWDNLFGEATSLPAIEETVRQLRELEPNCPEALQDVQNHKQPSEWAQEGFKSAKTYAYLDGDLMPANSLLNPSEDLVPSISGEYLKHARTAADRAVIKAGQRLATSIRQALE